MTTETQSLMNLFDPSKLQESQNENNMLLEEWLSTPMTEAKITTAAPIIATTITLEAIQNLLYSSGYPVEEANMDTEFGPFEDTQFDVVVDVETTSLEKQQEKEEEKEAFTCDLSDDSLQDYCSDLSDVSEDDLTILPDMVMSDSDLELSCDSGIEAELYDIQENKNGNCEKCQKSAKKHNAEPCDKCGSYDQKSPKKRTQRKSKQDKTENKEDTIPHANCQFLWEFLHHLLETKDYDDCIAWRNPQKGIFRMVDHNMVAKLWGKQKKRKNMTYDKLSRALRYYYSKNILAKVSGQRLTYKFCRTPSGKKYPS
ncbi:ETS-related transcription factor Elf-4-like [Actinia tenebrosa]|uniref:ETS-related transcription factor Elf-4-like n=1 Tax=Actinia tenebrosa TaxID=6105 RepID=A0A6P8H8N2_ACTTE|nr:ETS-related transcription factor Elf-4-like [Actinia tenebrosa]